MEQVDHRSGRIFSYARHVHRLPRRVCTGLGAIVFKHPNRENTGLANARTVVVGRGFSRSACADLGLSKRHPNASGCCDHCKLPRGASRGRSQLVPRQPSAIPRVSTPTAVVACACRSRDALPRRFYAAFLLCLNLIAPRQSPAAPLQTCRQNRGPVL